MEQLLQELRVAIPAAFESDEYRSRKGAIEDALKQRQEQALEGIQRAAGERGVALLRTPAGLTFAPMRDGQAIEPDAFQALPEDEREQFQKDIETLQGDLQTARHQMPAMVKESRQRLRDLNRQITGFAADHLIDELRRSYDGLDNVLAYFDAVRNDVVENAEIFLPADESGPSTATATPGSTPSWSWGRARSSRGWRSGPSTAPPRSRRRGPTNRSRFPCGRRSARNCSSADDGA